MSESPKRDAGQVNVMVLSGYGLNCEAETAAGFRMAGATVETRHVGDLIENPARLDGVHLLCFIGGFSFGDHIASGRVFANRLRFRIGEHLARHVDRGGLVLGICNGFQTIVKMGLLPGFERRQGQLASQQVSLVDNERLGYRNAWVRLVIDEHSPCVFTRGMSASLLECPSRHGEGALVVRDEVVWKRLEQRHLIPVRYADADGNATQAWPDNPNGSPAGVAGLCDETGRVFGLMPHPEAYLYPENHPHWLAQRDAGTLPTVGGGLRLLENGVRAVLE